MHRSDIMACELKINPGTGIYQTSPDWHWECGERAIRDFDLWMIAGGEGMIQFDDGREFFLAAGISFLLPPGCCFHAVHERHSPILALAIHFDYIQQEIPGRPDRMPVLHLKLQNAYLMEQLMRRAIGCWQDRENAAAVAWLRCALLARDDEQEAAWNEPLPYLDAVKRLADRIRNNPAEDFSVAVAAREVHLCPDHFSRVFRQIIGQTPKAFQLHCRLDYARGLLLSSNLSCGRVGELAGFASPQYFHRQFRRLTGMAPGEFRSGGRR